MKKKMLKQNLEILRLKLDAVIEDAEYESSIVQEAMMEMHPLAQVEFWVRIAFLSNSLPKDVIPFIKDKTGFSFEKILCCLELSILKRDAIEGLQKCQYV